MPNYEVRKIEGDVANQGGPRAGISATHEKHVVDAPPLGGTRTLTNVGSTGMEHRTLDNAGSPGAPVALAAGASVNVTATLLVRCINNRTRIRITDTP